MATNSEMRRIYGLQRAKGTPAKFAWDIARYQTAEPAFDFLSELGCYGKERVSGEVGAFTVSVSVVGDDEGRLGDDDVSGTFTDDADDHTVRNTTYGSNGQGYKFYRPSEYTRQYGYSDARKAGMSKSQARDAYAARVQTDMADDANREWFGVTVTVSAEDTELAQTSMWGIDSIDGYNLQPYLWEVAAELIEEAFTIAREQLPSKINEIESTLNYLKGLQAETGETTV